MRPVAVTGARGRLGRAMMDALTARGVSVVGWSRPEYDLDDAATGRLLFERDRPSTVIHAAAWTDVDGCAREPERAEQRNARATTDLASVCAHGGARFVLISTNEVFDGKRSDGRGYEETDEPRPINAYGESKYRGELGAAEQYHWAGRDGDLAIVRTAWLFGPPGNDFPAKIVAAADRLLAGEPLKVVSDETGSPTYTPDLADGLLRLLRADAHGGIYHLTNEGRASRLEFAQQVLKRCRPGQTVTPISRRDFVRPSTPPAWAVLQNIRAAALGVALRPWQDAFEAYAPALLAA